MFTFSRKSIRRTAALLIASAVATASALCWPPERNLPSLDPILQPIQQFEWLGYDALFAWRGPLPSQIDKRIAVVGFSKDTEGVNQLVDGKAVSWPPPRRFHARVVDNLVADGAEVIAFDVLMNEASDKENDRALDSALARAAGRCVLACRIDRNQTESSSSKDMVGPYHDDALGIDFERNATEAFVDVTTDNDNVIRRIYPLQKFQGEWLPSLATAAFCKLTGRKVEDSRVTPSTMYVGGDPVPRTGPTIVDPTDPENTMGSAYVDFPAGLNTFPIYTYQQVYRGEFPRGTFKDKVVFIGVSGLELTTGQNDRFYTSYSSFSPERAGGQVTRYVYGVVVQAQMLNALLGQDFIHQAALWQIWLITFFVSSLGTFAVRNSLTWRGPLLLLVSVAGYVVLVFTMFVERHIYLPWVLPGIFMLGSAAAVAWFERGHMKKMWSGYVSPAYMEVMLREGFEAKPRLLNATVIFGDIRGFTTFSEKHDPEIVVQVLDKHLEKLVHIVFEEQGTVDKFLGDGVMIVFGAPKPLPDAEVRAVRAAWRMLEAAMIPVTDDKGVPYVLATGFGVTTGPLVAGHVGSKELSSFTLIGDTVNMAARLQAVTGQPDLIIDERTYDKVRDLVEVDYLGEKDLKGKSQSVACYKVTGWKDGSFTTSAGGAAAQMEKERTEV